jgi:hypothetical protein
MPRRMAYTIDVGVPAAQMYRDFTDIGYWEDLVEFYRSHGTRTEIARFATGQSGTEIAFAHIMSAQDLPAIARPVVPGTFTVTREQSFAPFDADADRARGHYRAAVPVAPVDITGQYLLHETGGGSQMMLETTCTVRVPLIGGQIEQLVVNGLKTLFAMEGEFTADWIAANH